MKHIHRKAGRQYVNQWLSGNGNIGWSLLLQGTTDLQTRNQRKPVCQKAENIKIQKQSQTTFKMLSQGKLKINKIRSIRSNFDYDKQK